PKVEPSLELVADLIKNPHAKVRASDRWWCDCRMVETLLRNLHAAISRRDEDYYLGSIAFARARDEALRLMDGRRRLAVISVLLDHACWFVRLKAQVLSAETFP